MATAAMFSFSWEAEADLTSLCGDSAESRDSPVGAGVEDKEREVMVGRVRRPFPQAPGTNRKLSMVAVWRVRRRICRSRKGPKSNHYLLGQRGGSRSRLPNRVRPLA